MLLIGDLFPLLFVRDAPGLREVNREDTIVCQLEQDWVLQVIIDFLAQGELRAVYREELHLFLRELRVIRQSVGYLLQ